MTFSKPCPFTSALHPSVNRPPLPGGLRAPHQGLPYWPPGIASSQNMAPEHSASVTGAFFFPGQKERKEGCVRSESAGGRQQLERWGATTTTTCCCCCCWRSRPEFKRCSRSCWIEGKLLFSIHVTLRLDFFSLQEHRWKTA